MVLRFCQKELVDDVSIRSKGAVQMSYKGVGDSIGYSFYVASATRMGYDDSECK